MASEDGFGTLVDVNPRDAWGLEAKDFTPWLADNLDRLSQAIGVPLQLTGREVGIGRYSADILAVNPQEGTKVLIENQLAWSDHTHLGQVLTYLAGSEAEIVIWLAPWFREEHLSAMRWLNQHTDTRFSFFAVRLRVVQIANSPYAPLFEVLEKPNNWDRSLQEKVREAVGDKENTAWRRAFWDRYTVRFPEAGGDRGGGGHGSSRWRTVPGTPYVISRWVAADNVGVFVRGERGVWTPTFREDLAKYSAKLSPLLGAALGDNEWYPFLKQANLDVADAAQADAAIDWLETETQRYVDVLSGFNGETD